MSNRPILSTSVLKHLVIALGSCTGGQPPSGVETFRLLDRALKPHVAELSFALPGARPRPGADNWIELAVQPHHDFRAPGYDGRSIVDVAFSLKSHRVVSSSAPSARIGFCDLAAHVWALLAPAERVSAERRLLALIGYAYLKSLIDPQPKRSEVA